MPKKINIENNHQFVELLRKKVNNINFDSPIIIDKIEVIFIKVRGKTSTQMVKVFSSSFSNNKINYKYFIERGWSHEIALEKSENNKHSESNFIKKYGIELGKEKWQQFLENSHISESNFIKKYGIELGKEKWQQLSKSRKRQHSIERYEELYGVEAQSKLDSANEKKKPSMKNWIRIHGKREGEKRWNKFCKNNSIQNTLVGFKSKYGEIEGEQRYLKVCKSKAMTKSKFVELYGDSIGKTKYKEMIEKRAKMGQWDNASKESLKFFLPFYRILKRKFGISKGDVFIGTKNSKEYYLLDDKTIRFYDFTIPSLNLIIEYNGSTWHPNKNKLTDLEWNEWKLPFTKITADEKYNDDQYKKKLAINNGYRYFEVWDTDDKKAVTNFIISNL